jgi:hypothetical protein
MTENVSENQDGQANDVQDPAQPNQVDEAVQTAPQPAQVSPGQVEESPSSPDAEDSNTNEVNPNKGYSHVAGQPATGSSDES